MRWPNKNPSHFQWQPFCHIPNPNVREISHNFRYKKSKKNSENIWSAIIEFCRRYYLLYFMKFFQKNCKPFCNMASILVCITRRPCLTVPVGPIPQSSCQLICVEGINNLKCCKFFSEIFIIQVTWKIHFSYYHRSF